MRTQGFSKDDARRYRNYTGDSYQYARDVLPACRVLDPLPAASGAQALLESQVMQYVGAGNAWWTHPLGIAGTRITHTGLLVFLDRHTELSAGQMYPMSAFTAENLLPVAEIGSQVFGAIGLRAHTRSSTDLVVTSVDGDGEVVLRAAKDEAPDERANWDKSLIRRSAEIADDNNFVPLWHQPGMTAYEHEDLARYARVRQDERSMAWIGSALLRRIGLFATASAAYSTKSWINPGEWVFELSVDSSVDGSNHEALLDQLSAKRWGLPLIVTKDVCACSKAAPDGEDGYQCVFWLKHESGLPGAIQLRFSCSSLSDRDRLRERFQRLGSSRKWLDKVLPNRGSARGGVR